MTTNGKTFPVLARVFSRSRAKRSSNPATSPPRTTCFDIFSPPPGDSDVISHVDRLSSNETKIAPRSVRIAVGASGRSAKVCMVASRVGDSNLTLPECRSLSTSPWDLEGKPAVGENIRHHRRVASRARRVCRALQRNLARRPARLSYSTQTPASWSAIQQRQRKPSAVARILGDGKRQRTRVFTELQSHYSYGLLKHENPLSLPR